MHGSTAILFWCYKDVAVCVDRISLLRRLNPSAFIFVLYGGEKDAEQDMRAALSEFADDFWAFDLDREPLWKWLHGDRVIARWHEVRGSNLEGWTHLFICQWDMLVAAPVDRLLEGMPEDAVVATGLLELADVKKWWFWVRGFKNRLKLLGFRARLLLLERYVGPILTAPFIVFCAPRAFLDRLASTRVGEIGFIEYRCPTLAAAWGFTLWTTPQLEAWRPANPNTRDIPNNRKIISAQKEPVEHSLIQAELHKQDGFRVFHPVHATDEEAGLLGLLG